MSHLCYRHQQKAQNLCEMTPRCCDSSGSKNQKIADAKLLSRPITRSTFKDPLLGCNSTAEGSCMCSYWKRKYLVKNFKEKSQFNVGNSCQVDEHFCYEKPTNCVNFPFECEDLKVEECCEIPQCEDPYEKEEDQCQKKKSCFKKKCCKRDSPNDCGKDNKICENPKFPTVTGCRTPGKVVLNFNMNLTPELTDMFERIL